MKYFTHYAIKKLTKHEKSSSDYGEEVEILKSLDHPNIVRYHESIEDTDHSFIVMELCSGGSLNKYRV